MLKLLATKFHGTQPAAIVTHAVSSELGSTAARSSMNFKSTSTPGPFQGEEAHDASALRWPTTLLALLVVILGGLASARQPLGPWLPFIGILGVAIALVCLWRKSPTWATWLIALVTAWFVLTDVGGSLRTWRTISSHPDAWSYGGLADYLKNHPRGLSEGMSLLDQWASHLQNTRFASACILALSICFTGHDHLIEAHALFYGLCLISLFFSMSSLGRALELSGRQSRVLGAIAVAFGWTVNAVVYGNYDNLLFVALMPAVLAAWLDWVSGRISGRTFLLHAPVVTAALFYTYPEGLALSGALIVPLVLVDLWRLRADWPRLKVITGAGTLVIVLTAPFLPVFRTFLMSQISYGASGLAHDASRPGIGSFPGLLDLRRAGAAFWSLGSEYPTSSGGVAFLVLPAIFFVLAGLGIWQLGKKQSWYPWVLVPFGALLLWQAHYSRFDYGTYKVIFCAQWWLFPALLKGVLWLSDRIPRPGAATALLIVLGFGAIAQRWNFRSQRLWPAMPIIQSASELPKLESITKGAPILLNIDDSVGQLWAVAYLRDQPLALVLPKSYLGMAGLQHLLAQAKPVAVRDDMFTLQSGQEPEAIWHNENFLLKVRTAESVLVAVENPNGLEAVNGAPFLWIGTSQPTTFVINAFQAGEFELHSSRLDFGPSGRPSATHPIEVTDAAGKHEVILHAGDLSIPIKLQMGMNRVTIRSVSPLAGATFANGDTRELMIGLTSYSVKSASPARP